MHEVLTLCAVATGTGGSVAAVLLLLRLAHGGNASMHRTRESVGLLHMVRGRGAIDVSTLERMLRKETLLLERLTSSRSSLREVVVEEE